MKAITEFSLEIPDEPREEWPLKLRALRNGLPTSLHLPGRTLRYQFRGKNEFLFITDYDCPYEECTEFTLCDKNLVCRGRCMAGAPYCTVDVSHVEWIDRQHLKVLFHGDDDEWMLSIRGWHIPILYPRLKLRRCKTSALMPNLAR